MKTLTLAAVASGFLLAACAGREAHPVAVVQPTDDALSCPAIAAQVSANEAQARDLQSQRSAHNVDNAVVGAVGVVLFWPALFALDMTDYEKQEMTALRERNNYLQQVAEQHGCNKPTTASAIAPTTASTASALPVCSPFYSGPATGDCTPRPSQMPAD